MATLDGLNAEGVHPEDSKRVLYLLLGEGRIQVFEDSLKILQMSLHDCVLKHVLHVVHQVLDPLRTVRFVVSRK